MGGNGVTERRKLFAVKLSGQALNLCVKTGAWSCLPNTLSTFNSPTSVVILDELGEPSLLLLGPFLVILKHFLIAAFSEAEKP